MSVKTTQIYSGSGGGLGLKREKYFSRPPPTRAIIPVACPLGMFENLFVAGRSNAQTKTAHTPLRRQSNFALDVIFMVG